MADSTTATGTEGDAPKAGESAPGAEAPKTPEAPKPEGTSVEFDGPYDEARAKALIEKLRNEAKTAKEKAAEYEKAENERKQAEMSDLQKAIARAEKAEADLAERTKADLVKTVAAKHEVPAELLTASTEEELEAQAKALAAFIGEKKTTAPGSKPKPKLTPAAGGDSSEPTDIDGIADRIRRR